MSSSRNPELLMIVAVEEYTDVDDANTSDLDENNINSSNMNVLLSNTPSVSILLSFG
jgi:hypothetical protein